MTAEPTRPPRPSARERTRRLLHEAARELLRTGGPLTVQATADLDAWAHRLDALGVEHGPIHDQDQPVLATLVVSDPDGIPVELFWTAG